MPINSSESYYEREIVMGMAAGQARLLSITSRLSDNELRAQIINNDKMRLATKSSQVSEAYIQALNDSKMMFANYDANNNATYNNLTFNALTAYNQYNNQYALINSSGKILVSERDSVNFENAAGNLDKFLEAYGLKQTTTFFDNLPTVNGKVQYPTLDVVSTNKNDPHYNEIIFGNPCTPDELKKMYIGADNIEEKAPYRYDNIISSENYYNYQKLFDVYGTHQDAFYLTISDKMSEILDNYEGFGLGQAKEHEDPNNPNKKSTNYAFYDAKLDHDLFAYLEGHNNSEGIVEVANKLSSYINGDYSKYFADEFKHNGTDDNCYLCSLNKQLDEIKSGKGTTTSNASEKLLYESDGSIRYGDYKLFPPSTVQVQDGENFVPATNATLSGNGSTCTLTITNGESKTIVSNIPYTEPADGTNPQLNITTYYSDTERIQMAKDVITSMRNAIYKVWDPTNKDFIDTNKVEFKDYSKASNDLMKQLGIEEIVLRDDDGNETGRWKVDTEVTKANKSDAVKAFDKLSDILGYAMEKSESADFYCTDEHFDDEGNPFECDGQRKHKINYSLVSNDNNQQTDFIINKDKLDDFVEIRDSILLNYIMDTYGEPVFTWIDKSSPKDSYNENGTAKAKWYTNLFEHMQTSGYMVLKDGLASSAEWIKFAFESGIVSMEQIDENDNWKSISYNSCSDITEQTNTAAVTKAEAEYNAAMKKIENKDKMYDLELKNIDTEHNSLQTEYESIKGAIGKNIERTFKLYA